MYKTKSNHSVKPQFFLYPKRKSVTCSEATLYMRISYQFTKVDKSLGIKILYKLWDNQNHRISNSSHHQKQLEETCSELKEKIMGAFYLLSQNKAETTLREVMDLALAENEKKSYSLFGVFNEFLVKMEKQSLLSRQKSNLRKHNTCLKHLKAFVKAYLNSNDISFNRINRSFVDEFELYLKTDCGNGHNAAMKLLQIFKKVYRIAVDNRWTSNNAFSGKRLSYKDVDIEILTETEIQALKDINLGKGYLDKSRKLFLFCVYTGLSYIDMQHLRRKHIEFSPASGQYLIRKKREKTGVEFMLPLFHPAKNLLEGWLPGWDNAAAETLLVPGISNQKYNLYLKELFALLSIEKKIRSHCARHSFATTLALENGVPIESVSKMLGHSKISQTQKYAKVTTLKIERETRELFNLLKN